MSLAIGFGLMLINRARRIGSAVHVEVPRSTTSSRRSTEPTCSMPLAAVAVVATVIQGGTSFALAQVVSIAAQRAITEMRKRVQAHVLRLPISYFDSTKTGVLISRVMSDAEGVRNLVGTGLIQLVGSVMTAVMALAVLFYVNWKLTSATLVLLVGFGAMMTIGVQASASALPRARRDQRRGHRPPHRDDRRHSAREDLRRRAARTTRVRARRAQALSQRREDDHRHVGRRRRNGRARRNDRRAAHRHRRTARCSTDR